MDDGTLDAVRFHWGDAYDIKRDAAGGCRAVRRDGLGDELRAPDPEELNKLIAADYRARPVSRDVT